MSLSALEAGEAAVVPGTAPLDGQAEGFLVRSQRADKNCRRISANAGLLRFVRTEYDHFFIDLSGTADDYLAKFSSKSRSTLRRKLRRFAELGGGTIDWREYRTPDELETFYRLARPLSQRTYQERLLDAGLPGDDEFRRQMTALAAADAVRAYILFLDGKPVSYLYCPAEDGVLIYAYLGYDPALAKYSPGTVLQWVALEKLFAEERFRLFDFTEGQGEHKRFFSTGSVRCADIIYLRCTHQNCALLCLIWLCDAAGTAGGTLLHRLGLKARFKRLLRHASFVTT